MGEQPGCIEGHGDDRYGDEGHGDGDTPGAGRCIADDHAIGAAARRILCRTIKARTRAYLRRPLMLETLHPGLSAAQPIGLIAVAGHILDRESRTVRRRIGLGGETVLINARAALLLGRLERRRARGPGRGLDQGPEPGMGAAVSRGSKAAGTSVT